MINNFEKASETLMKLVNHTPHFNCVTCNKLQKNIFNI